MCLELEPWLIPIAAAGLGTTKKDEMFRRKKRERSEDVKTTDDVKRYTQELLAALQALINMGDLCADGKAQACTALGKLRALADELVPGWRVVSKQRPAEDDATPNDLAKAKRMAIAQIESIRADIEKRMGGIMEGMSADVLASLDGHWRWLRDLTLQQIRNYPS
jgi:hypothetical protein